MRAAACNIAYASGNTDAKYYNTGITYSTTMTKINNLQRIIEQRLSEPIDMHAHIRTTVI